jgi:TolB-like protein
MMNHAKSILFARYQHSDWVGPALAFGSANFSENDENNHFVLVPVSDDATTRSPSTSTAHAKEIRRVGIVVPRWRGRKAIREALKKLDNVDIQVDARIYSVWEDGKRAKQTPAIPELVAKRGQPLPVKSRDPQGLAEEVEAYLERVLGRALEPAAAADTPRPLAITSSDRSGFPSGPGIFPCQSAESRHRPFYHLFTARSWPPRVLLVHSDHEMKARWDPRREARIRVGNPMEPPEKHESALRACLLAAALGLILSIAGPATGWGESPPPALCVLDFLSLDEKGELSWLEAGLADLMIRTLGRSGSHRVLERRRLREILREHALEAQGITEGEAVRRARLARADLVLLGSFARSGDELGVQARLIRLSDQRVVAAARWTGSPDRVLEAPKWLAERLLAGVGARLPGAGLESEVPARIDVARAYYTGVRGFDDGRYPEALAHYLEAAGSGGEFPPADAAVLEMYDLLGQSEHAVLFARRVARAHEARRDVGRVVEYLYAAAERALDPLGNRRVASALLEQLLARVSEREREAGEIARTKREILERIAESPGKLLGDPEIRHRMWGSDIEGEVVRRAEARARGGYEVVEDGRSIVKPVPPPSLFMWKVRAKRMLARSYAGDGRIRAALDLYAELVEDHAFLAGQPVLHGAVSGPILLEAHFMGLRHHAGTGDLVRDHPINRLNRLNPVEDRSVFARDFADPSADPRARVSSRYPGRGHEYFDFAAPHGFQIDAVTLQAEVAGLASFAIDRPDPRGWPPQLSLSKRVEKLDLRRGEHERTIRLPPGSELVSIDASWGLNPYSSSLADAIYHRALGPDDGRDLVRWRAVFALSRRSKEPADSPGPAPIAPGVIRRAPDAEGWDDSFIVRIGHQGAYSGSPRLDVYAEDWLVAVLDGDLRIVRQREPHLEVKLPVTINTADREFDASLVRTHEDRWALLWARGSSPRHARRFVALSSDFLEWETPRRLEFEGAERLAGYTYGQAEPPERTVNVAAVPGGYLMLLAQGFVRRSTDLRRWGPAELALPPHTARNRLTKTADGMLWAVYEAPSDAREPYSERDWLHGYFLIDGKRYRHSTELRVARSRDGLRWTPAGARVFAGQGSGLWVFPIAERRIGIAMGFNNLFVKWFTAAEDGALRDVEADLRLTHQSETSGFFARRGSLVCVRPIFDLESQQKVLLGMSSRDLYRKLAR